MGPGRAGRPAGLRAAHRPRPRAGRGQRQRRALSEGSWAFRAQLAVDGDTRPENNESWAFTIVGPAARVLLVEGTPNEANAVREALLGAGIQVDRQRPQLLPTVADRLQPYEAVVLANVHGADLRGTRCRP